MNDTARTTPPGSPEALDQGCHCSFLLNSEQDTDFVNPLCPLHGAQREEGSSS